VKVRRPRLLIVLAIALIVVGCTQPGGPRASAPGGSSPAASAPVGSSPSASSDYGY